MNYNHQVKQAVLIEYIFTQLLLKISDECLMLNLFKIYIFLYTINLESII